MRSLSCSTKLSGRSVYSPRTHLKNLYSSAMGSENRDVFVPRTAGLAVLEPLSNEPQQVRLLVNIYVDPDIQHVPCPLRINLHGIFLSAYQRNLIRAQEAINCYTADRMMIGERL